MKAQTIYVAEDGSRWDSPEQATAREELIARVAKIMEPLPEVKDRNCDFANGGGYVQRDPHVLETVRRQIIDLCREMMPKLWDFDEDPYYRHISHWGRAVDDYGHGPVRDAIYRLMRMDDKGREWGQPYFANNPDEGTQKEWAE